MDHQPIIEAARSIPPGWRMMSVEELAGQAGLVCDGDWVESKDQDPDGGVRLIQLADIGDGFFRNRSDRFLTVEAAKRLNCTFLKPGDVLIARMPDPLGRACIFPDIGMPAVTVVDVCVWRSGDDLTNPRWLMHFLNSPVMRTKIQEQATGTTRQRITGARLKATDIPVPSLSQQHEIASRIDELFGEIEAGEQELAAAKADLARYRRSVLKAAVTGELTKDWRTKNPPTETGADLLARILKERRARWETAELAKMKTKGTSPKNDAWKSKYPEPIPPNTDDLPNLPNGWVWASVDQLSFIESGQTPKGIEEVAKSEGEIPWFKVSSMTEFGNDTWLQNSRWWLTRKECFELGVRIFDSGTIAFPKLGGALLTNKRRRLKQDSGLDLNNMGVTPIEPGLDYLWLYFLGLDLAKLADGSVVPQLKKSQVEPLAIGLPGCDELRCSVEIAREHLAAHDELEAEIASASIKLLRMRQSILSAAFSGRLLDDAGVVHSATKVRQVA